MTPWEARLREKLGSAQPGPLPEAKPFSSVLVPIGWNTETKRDEILLTKRTMGVLTHKGQISFPGGFHSPKDRTLLDTALRETWEEIGLESQYVEILGTLSTVKTLRRISIHPWVGRVPFPHSYLLNAAEVDRLVILPLTQLMEEGVNPVKVDVEGIHVQSIGISVDGELVWGATAMMLKELRGLLL